MTSLKTRRGLIRASRATAIVFSVSLAVQAYFSAWERQPAPLNAIHHPDPNPNDIPRQTVWDLIRNERNLTTFANLVGEFDDIVSGLQEPKASFTLYAPVDGAFEQETFPYDLPWFYWKFLVGYHMGQGGLSAQALQTQNTVPSFVNADIYFKNRQRISVQKKDAEVVSLNYRANLVVASTRAAVNGYVHHLDRLLMLPESAADILRSTPEFGVFRNGLIQTGLATIVNDTSTHLGQTLFVPSNTAFKQLGRKVNRFLFGPGGKAYLKALLGYHIVANETLFSDVIFPVNNEKQLPLSGDYVRSMTTLARGCNLSAASMERPHSNRRLITVNGAVPVTRPDTVVMDGVVHGIDSILLPPAVRAEAEAQPGKPNTGWRRFLASFTRRGGKLTLDELMERLQPLVDSDGVL